MSEKVPVSEEVPAEVYEKLAQNNIELSKEEKEYFELMYQHSKNADKELPPELLEKIAGGFCDKHPRLKSALAIVGLASAVANTALLAGAVGGGLYMHKTVLSKLEDEDMNTIAEHGEKIGKHAGKIGEVLSAVRDRGKSR